MVLREDEVPGSWLGGPCALATLIEANRIAQLAGPAKRMLTPAILHSASDGELFTRCVNPVL